MYFTTISETLTEQRKLVALINHKTQMNWNKIKMSN